MKKIKDSIFAFGMSLIGFVITILALNLFCGCTTTSVAADKYIEELERTLEINNISIDDTVGGSDAYSAYYNI